MLLTRRKIVRVALLTMTALLIIWLVRITDTRYLVRLALQKIQSFGPLAPLYFMLAYVVACLTFFPGFILTLGAGILFGVVEGTLYVTTGATIGAGCAFLISRYFARDWVLEKFGANEKFRAIDDAVARDGWKVVGLIRLSPAFPFIPLNLLFGLTKVRFSHFLIATWIAMIPVCVMFVYLGTLIGDIAALGSQPMATGKAKWVVSGVGVVTTAIVTVFVTRLARRALAPRLNEELEDRAEPG